MKKMRVIRSPGTNRGNNLVNDISDGSFTKCAILSQRTVLYLYSSCDCLRHNIDLTNLEE